MPNLRHCALILVLLLGPAGPRAVHAQAAKAGLADSDCLSCHGQRGFKSDSGRDLFVNEAKHKSSVHADLSCSTCHTDVKEFPHPARVAKVECSACHAEETTDAAKSVHFTLGNLTCASCHGSGHDAQAASKLMPRQCTVCHAQEVKALLASAHGQAAKKGDPQSPTCESCHGPMHKVLSSQAPLSPVAKKNLPNTCGSCHSDAGFLAKHRIPFARPVESYEASVHGRALAAGNDNAASCSDCHSSHAIFGGRDSRSKTNHWNVPATCGSCHTKIQAAYMASVHGQAVLHGSVDSPVCTDCHGEHMILAPSEAQSLVNPAQVSGATCGRCHSDARLNARYNLPLDRVPTFADSFHGLAARSGSQSVANCSSCHGVHNIFPPSDPRSMVNAANLAQTCGACHPGAGSTFAIGPVHVGMGQSENVVVRWIRRFYWVLIPLAVGFMFFHQLFDFLRKLRMNQLTRTGGEVARMNMKFRIAHWLVMASFVLLVVTGFALKFPEAWWARPLLLGEGHFSFRGTAHRVAAVILLFALAYHIVHLAVVRRDRVILRQLMPGTADLRDLRGMFLYNVGLSKTRPTFGMFSYSEKIEYWAFLWGTAVMAGSGLILWFNNLALRYFPKWVSDAATALHFYEAILATLSILIWHMYTVVFDPDVYPMDRSWLTGKTSADHLRHTRPEYYATLVEPPEMAAATAPVDDPTPTGNSSTSSEPGEKPPPTPLPPESSSAS
jgi:cytochrome b subunit of formate dehydrogenase